MAGSTQLTTLKNVGTVNTHIYQMIDNYIYLYHVKNNTGGTGAFIVIPAYADSVTDSLQVQFDSSTPLSRSAPIYSYKNSGPRTIQVQFDLHRDMMTQINYGVSNASVEIANGNPNNDDYVDYMIKAVQAAALPTYGESAKMVNPPIVAVRLGSDIFIKGVVTGDVGVTYKYPILSNGKYSTITIGFRVQEIDPYDADTVMTNGSYRGLSTTLEKKIWSSGSALTYRGVTNNTKTYSTK